MSIRFAPSGAKAAFACALASHAAAQTASSDGAAAPSSSSLPAVVITGDPLRSGTVTMPSSILQGEPLVMRRGSTLGETLEHLPGVASSYFGPNANRPVIRGQDGDRIRLLDNGGASVDASALSADHAATLDPMVVERVEVLRGPAALLYGGGAVGGVVNIIDNRIPRAPLSDPEGSVSARFGGPARERSASALVESGAEGFAVHADAFRRRTDDLRVPSFDRPIDGGSDRRDRVRNSASEAEGGALGGGWVGRRGHLGASVDTYRNDYGTVAEEEVTIRMRRDKWALDGEARDLGGPIVTVRGRVGFTQYDHREFEGSEVGTTFDSRGTDTRFEFEHAPVTLPSGPLRGVVGVQTEATRFSAVGEEAFVPDTRSRQAALFVVEELTAGRLSFQAGGRIERASVRSEGDADGEARFGPSDRRRFDILSAAVGSAFRANDDWRFTAHVAYTERAPTFYELYANGVHVATAAYERGDADAEKEKGVNVDLGAEWTHGDHRIRAGVYAARYANYIALLPTGDPDFVNDEGEAFPIYAFDGVPARLWGAELETQWRLPIERQRVDLDARFDMARAVNRDTGDPLPRLPPSRATVGALARSGPWSVRLEVVHAARQSRVPAGDTATPSHTLVNGWVGHEFGARGADGLVFVKFNNVTDELAYNAASATNVRRLAPLPGRGVMAGLQLGF
jgi:iron complex outermembrane receptor protein